MRGLRRLPWPALCWRPRARQRLQCLCPARTLKGPDQVPWPRQAFRQPAPPPRPPLRYRNSAPPISARHAMPLPRQTGRTGRPRGSMRHAFRTPLPPNWCSGPGFSPKTAVQHLPKSPLSVSKIPTGRAWACWLFAPKMPCWPTPCRTTTFWPGSQPIRPLPAKARFASARHLSRPGKPTRAPPGFDAPGSIMITRQRARRKF